MIGREQPVKRVLIIEAQIKQYRAPFYDRLYAALANAGIQLRVAYSDPSPIEASKEDACDLPNEYGVKVKARWPIPGKLIYQDVVRDVVKADLVIVDQANKFVLNHLLLPLSLAGIKRTAFIGHGFNAREDRLWLSEWYRHTTINWVSWWFAYTEKTTRYLIRHGVPRAKITTVQNALDTDQIRGQARELSVEQKNHLRSQIGIPVSASVGIYCGTLDKVKNLPFLMDAAIKVRDQNTNFHLLLVGGGPEQALVQARIEAVPWVHFVGPRFGKEKAALLAISDAMLMPGAVGLVILDAFAAGLPLLSTRLSIHGPEIEYLNEGINGLLSEPDVADFADVVSSLLRDRDKLSRLRMGAQIAGAKYTIQNMAANVCDGIQKCLLRPSVVGIRT